jgi:hypothetical protein
VQLQAMPLAVQAGRCTQNWQTEPRLRAAQVACPETQRSGLVSPAPPGVVVSLSGGGGGRLRCARGGGGDACGQMPSSGGCTPEPPIEVAAVQPQGTREATQVGGDTQY